MSDQDRWYRHVGDHLRDVAGIVVQVIAVEVFAPAARAMAREVDGVAVVTQLVEVGHEVHIPAAAMDVAAMHEYKRRVAVVPLRGAVQCVQFPVCHG